MFHLLSIFCLLFLTSSIQLIGALPVEETSPKVLQSQETLRSPEEFIMNLAQESPINRKESQLKNPQAIPLFNSSLSRLESAFPHNDPQSLVYNQLNNGPVQEEPVMIAVPLSILPMAEEPVPLQAVAVMPASLLWNQHQPVSDTKLMKTTTMMSERGDIKRVTRSLGGFGGLGGYRYGWGNSGRWGGFGGYSRLGALGAYNNWGFGRVHSFGTGFHKFTPFWW